MVGTRSNNHADSGGSGELPSPPSLVEAIAAILSGRDEQTALLRQIAQQGAPQRLGSRNQNQPQFAGYQEFLGTQPPHFSKADEPLEADTWLRNIEFKFTLYQYNDADKASFAAQQLRGPAFTWWANHSAMLPAGHRVTWAEFKEAFRAHHIPVGIMRRKLEEFLALKQGNHNVLHYSQAFNNLSQYADYHVDTDAKKQACFRQGLNSKLKDRLAMIKFDSYSELVSGAITQEDAYLAHKADKKRKAPVVGSSSSAPQRFHFVQARPYRASYQQQSVTRPSQYQTVYRPPQSQFGYRPPQYHQQSYGAPRVPSSQQNMQRVQMQQ
ncbi:unnamed protein product [Urochloa humidicola]